MSKREVKDFITYWSAASPSERSNSQPFLLDLCDLLDIPRPDQHPGNGYFFEFPIVEQHADGSSSQGRIDLYKRACFVLESKQFQEAKAEASRLQQAAEDAGLFRPKKYSQPVRGTGAWDEAMIKARGQAERYVRALAGDNPPFVIVVDVGHSFELFADFSQAGKAYLPFPDPRTFRIRLTDLAGEKIRERLRLVWLNPTALDPAKQAADVTREVSAHLAELARSLESAGHQPEVVAQFLTRCLFCMFAEDVELLPHNSFTDLLESLPPSGEGFEKIIRQLFSEMNTGTGKDISLVLRKKLLHFNGGLFANDTVLPINGLQLGLLKNAARQNWRNVEPAIFGTLLERALDPNVRHQLGAHYTPRAYVERLVLPTIVEPLRAEWEYVRAAALTHARADDLKAARAEVNAFHERLCKITVLDPACGSGNFLYVALQHLKVLEGEVFDVAAQFGENFKLELESQTVDPHQFLGIEINPRAASIAELVLWIGYLQWHFKLHGKRTPPEPILRAFKNIQCRDAVLEYHGEPQQAVDPAGKPLTAWDRNSMKTDFVTGRLVPDETKRLPLLTYKNPRPASWPTADFIVGNPPFIGKGRLREDLGDGYAETLRGTYPEVPESADFVLYWWYKAAELVRAGDVKRFGLITTNSLRQTFARRVVQAQMSAVPPLSLLFAIPDHPWVDTAEGAAVRIAMTVGAAGSLPGELLEVTNEELQPDGSEMVTFKSQLGTIFADLTTGTDLSSAFSLKSNEGMTSMGVMLAGRGFIIEEQEAKALGSGKNSGLAAVLRPIRNGKDLLDEPRNMYVIDFTGLSLEEARQMFPALFQILLTRVKPERDQNRDQQFREKWWLFGRSRPEVRLMTKGLSRFVATVETAKHRLFEFLSSEILPEHRLIAFGTDDAFHLGVLSSRIHVTFALAVGGTLEDRPVYNKTRCFDPFPFPLCSEPEKMPIRKLAEELDAHRKRVQEAEHGLTLTGLYNVLEKVRSGEPLTDKERAIHDKGLVSVLKQLHDDLDAAVFAAYGWEDLCEHWQKAHRGEIYDFERGGYMILDASPEQLIASIMEFENALTAEILKRLVALNAQRAAEEKRGVIHWLRPEYQATSQKELTLPLPQPSRLDKHAKKTKPKPSPAAKSLWPKSLPDRVKMVETALHQFGGFATPAELAKQFKRAQPADVAEILETLVTLGRARQQGETFSR